MKKYYSLFTLVALFLTVPLITQAQEATQEAVIVILHDKSEITGTMVEEDDQKIVVQTQSLGLVTFQKTEIKKLIRLDDKGRMPNPNPTRYFLGQSAYTLEKGEGYYQNIMAFVNLASYGLTDRLSITGGIELLTLASGAPIIFGNIKYGIPVTSKFNMAISGTYITWTTDLFDSEFNLGALSFLGTYGTKENNLTIGAGYGLASGSISDSPVITIGGMLRISNKLGLLTENYVLTGDVGGGTSSLGVRFIGKKKTIDLFIFQGGIPAVDIVLKF